MLHESLLSGEKMSWSAFRPIGERNKPPTSIVETHRSETAAGLMWAIGEDIAKGLEVVIKYNNAPDAPLFRVRKHNIDIGDCKLERIIFP